MTKRQEGCVGGPTKSAVRDTDDRDALLAPPAVVCRVTVAVISRAVTPGSVTRPASTAFDHASGSETRMSVTVV